VQPEYPHRVQFRNAPLALFRRSGAAAPRPNLLVLGIQPEENICWSLKEKFRDR
jgi:glucose-6-phosphate 1-dehydrogenase